MAQPNNPAFAQSASASETLGAFWSWWSGRLAECVPAPARAWFAGRDQTMVLDWERDGLSLKRVGGAGIVSAPLTRAALEISSNPKADDFAAAMKQIAARVRGPITLALGESRVLRKPLRLPLAVRENLRVAVGYDIDRLTPFPVGSVMFDAAEKSVDHASRVVHADFVATPRAPVDALLAAAQRAGVQINRIIPAAQDAAGNLNMLRSGDAALARPWWQSPHLWLGLLTAGLLGAVLAFPVWQKREQIVAAQPVMAQAEKDATETDKVLRELQLRVSQYNFLPAKRHTSPFAVQVLDEVTKLLPDDTWVQNFELKTVRSTNASAAGGTTNIANRELQLQGESESSSKLIPTFEASPLFGTPQFKSPLTKLNYPGQNVNGDRFHVAMEIKTAPLPAAVPITTQIVAAPIPAAQNVAPAVPVAPAGAAKSAEKATDRAAEKAPEKALPPMPAIPTEGKK